MLSHVMVGTNDIERAKRFYDAVLGTLGAPEAIRNESRSGHQRIFYIHNGSRFGVSQPINDEPAVPANGATIGFKCTSFEQLKAFHETALAHGGVSIEEPPGLRDGPTGPVYLGYVRDPDGNKLCVMFRPT